LAAGNFQVNSMEYPANTIPGRELADLQKRFSHERAALLSCHPENTSAQGRAIWCLTVSMAVRQQIERRILRRICVDPWACTSAMLDTAAKMASHSSARLRASNGCIPNTTNMPVVRPLHSNCLRM